MIFKEKICKIIHLFSRDCSENARKFKQIITIGRLSEKIQKKDLECDFAKRLILAGEREKENSSSKFW